MTLLITHRYGFGYDPNEGHNIVIYHSKVRLPKMASTNNEGHLQWCIMQA